MHKKLNPEEFENNQNFINQNLRNKLKTIIPKEISNYVISNFIFNLRIKNWYGLLC